METRKKTILQQGFLQQLYHNFRTLVPPITEHKYLAILGRWCPLTRDINTLAYHFRKRWDIITYDNIKIH